MSFFTRLSATNIWKSVTGVSAAGRKRGRGKGKDRAIVKDFNQGQKIGLGRKKLIMPVLNTELFASSKLPVIEELGDDAEFSERLAESRTRMDTRRRMQELPIERGWSGGRTHGRKAGAPEAQDGEPIEGFQSTVLMLRPLNSMHGVKGRVKKMQALVVTGNGNGLAGFAECTGIEGRTAVRHARNLAGQYLVKIERWDNHTVMHDFFSKYYYTTIHVERKPKGFGIRAHRTIKAICEAFGITDLYAKIEGSANDQINVTKAFFLGLMNQKNYQDMANEKGLHLVDVREENFHYPTVLASPESGMERLNVVRNPDENLDFTYYIYDGKIRQVKAKPSNPFEGLKSWVKHLDREDYVKNREKTLLTLAAKYGDTRVLDVFPYFKTNSAAFNKEDS